LPPFYRDEHLFVDPLQQVVILDTETVRLTPMQYRVLALLVEHSGEVVPRATLSVQVRGDARGASPRRVDAHGSGLRKRLGIYADQYIETVISVGYRFRPAALRHV
jgi:DNA-binding response OmpR family regulator